MGPRCRFHRHLLRGGCRDSSLDAECTRVEWDLVSAAIRSQLRVYVVYITCYWVSPNVCLSRLGGCIDGSLVIVRTSHRSAADLFSRLWSGCFFAALPGRQARSFVLAQGFAYVHVPLGCSGGFACDTGCTSHWGKSLLQACGVYARSLAALALD